jgi:glycosyltransferase involved in cell wall biosynthesis
VVVLAYGALSSRKGIEALLRACERLEQPQRFVVLLAGRQDPNVTHQIARRRATLVNRGIRLLEWNRFLDDKSEAVAFAAADMVWMGYFGFLGSSGVLLQSAKAGLPIIACNEGTIGWTTRQHGLGLTIDPMDATEVASAINKLAGNHSFRRQCGDRGILLAKQHTPERFGVAICDMIKEAANSNYLCA